MTDETANDLSDACAKLERAGVLLKQLAENGRRGTPPAATAITAAIAVAENARHQLHGARPKLEGSARERILDYLRQNEGGVVTAEELSQVAGIHAWGRRIRELRSEGHHIEHLASGSYRYTDRYIA